MRATLPLKRITLLFDYGETILLNRTNTFDTKYNTFNTRESNKQAERINLRYKIIIVSIEQWKKKREKKGKKRRSGESFIEYQRNMLGLSFTSQPWCLYKLEHLCFRTSTCFSSFLLTYQSFISSNIPILSFLFHPFIGN